MIISYIIPAYNASASIGKCIEHILTQQGTHNIEVIVVNDGSSDNTAEIISKYPIVFFNRPHLGASSTRNFGLSKSTGDYIVMVDSDTFLDKDWTIKCLAFDPNSYDILSTNDFEYHKNIPWCITYIKRIQKNPYVTIDNLIGFIGNGCFIPARIKPLIIYDSMYYVGGEDIDLLFNLIKKQVRIRAVLGPSFIHKHVHRSTHVKYLSFIKKKILFGYGSIRTYFKHPDIEYAKRDAKGNLWVLPLYPFLWLYKKLITF